MALHSFLTVGLPLFVALLAGQAEATTCNTTSLCPTANPCCSDYGFCGVEQFCLGGCNPWASESLDSCRPAPICVSKTHTFTNTSRIINATEYEGDATEHDWVIEGETLESLDGDLVLGLTEGNPGTKISSTRYVHYGRMSAVLKTSPAPGVITTFITMSDVKDEIDWEMVGSEANEAQNNYFWQGVIPTPSNGDYARDLPNTASNYITYTIDWQPESITWEINGNVVRTLSKADTLDEATGVYRFPSTPSRMQASIWGGGTESNAAGTIEWAGGMVDWNSPEYQAAGRYYALLKSITVECANQQTAPNLTSYVYASGKDVAEPIISYTNQSTELGGAMPTGRGSLGPMHGIFVGGATLLMLVMGAL